MSEIQLRSIQNILGSMVARLLAETDLNDVSPGSVFLTLLEAAASSDYQLEAKLLQILNLRNIDKTTGADLENLAFEQGLSPTRIGATPAQVSLTIGDSAFTKIFSNIYAGSSAPVAGDDTIKIVNGSSFPASGTIYIGRNTRTSESATYISITNTGSYYLIQLAAPLTKDHLVGEEVVLAQGGIRTVPSGTIAFVEGIGLAPAVEFATQQDATLDDGESQITNVLATATLPGTSGRVGRKKINQFRSPPWSTATVINDQAATGGSDIETDSELRQRIKDHVHNLTGGTERAIIRSVIGVLDDEDKKRVVSAFLRKPIAEGDQTLLFIDDGTGFQPSFSGVGEELIVPSAAGTESILQLQKWPLVKAQCASVGTEPFNLSGGEVLYVDVDGQAEEKALPGNTYNTPGVVTAQEISEIINANFTTIEARAKDGQLFITPVAKDPDYIRVGEPTSGTDANAALRFPTTKQYTIRLYKNDRLLQKNGAEALVQSLRNDTWTGLTSSETLQFSIDGIDSPIVTFTDVDFATYTSVTAIADATVNDWVTMLNRTFIGVTAIARDDGTFVVKSNRGRSSDAEISVIGGTLATKLFPANAESQGFEPEFSVNRMNGSIILREALSAGDVLKAGTVNTRGFVATSALASFDLSATGGFAAEMVLIADAPFIEVPVAQTGTINFTAPDSRTMRLTGVAGQFSNVNENDAVHIWAVTGASGIFRVTKVSVSGDSVDVSSPSPATTSISLTGTTNKITFFRTEGLPQLVTLPVGSAISGDTLAQSILDQTISINAEVQDDSSVRIETARFDGEGALGIPSIAGTATNLGIEEANYLSNDPHVASIESSDLTGIPSDRYTVSTDDLSAPYNTLNANSTPFTFENHNRQVLTYIGANSKIIRQPLEKVDSDTLTFRSANPAQPVGLGQDMRATAVSGVEFGQADNMVFLVDNDPEKKTFDVPMYVDAVVANPSTPTTLQFDLEDSTGANLGSSARWLGYNFGDYRAWFKASGEFHATGDGGQLALKATSFGPNGEHIRASINYPVQASTSSAVAEFEVDPSTDEIRVRVSLASGTERLIGLLPGKRIYVEVSGSIIKYRFLPPTDLSQVLPDDIINLTDSQFQADNRGPVRITAVDSLTDTGNAWEFPTESVTADVTGNTSLQLSSPATILLQVGDTVTIGSDTRAITSVTDQSNFTVASPGFSNGVGQSATIQHSLIQAANVPTFAAAVDDLIVVGSSILKITSVISTTQFNVDTPFAFSGLISGTVSRLVLTGVKYNAGTSEDFEAQSAASVSVYPLTPAANTASQILSVINNTAGVKDLVTASHLGLPSGTYKTSTEDALANGDVDFGLQNGESYVYESASSSPSFRLKEALAVAPSIGDEVRLVPATPQNIVDHFSKKQITGLTVAADVDLVDQGRKVQISSKTPGGSGQIFAVGGRASGQNIITVRNNVQEISSSRAQIEVDRSSIDLMIPGHTIKISQPGRAKKQFPVSDPISSTQIEIQVPALEVGRLIIGVPLVLNYAYSQSGSPIWAVRNIGRNRIRFEIFSGTATIPSGLNVDDWVLVGNGSSYAGITTDSVFAPANQGWFQVRETDNSTYFDVDGQGVEEFVETSSSSFVFTSYHSARPGDQLALGFDTPISTENKGTYTITEVESTTQIKYSNSNVISEGPVALGVDGVGSISILDQSFTSYRKVEMVSPKPSDPTSRALITVSPGTDMGLFNEGLGAKISLPNRLSFGSDPVPGVNGYNYWTGLLRKVSRVVSGYQPDSETYPGVAAAGIDVEPRPPQINRISVSLKIKTARGVSLQSISDTIKTAIDGYVNSLGLGQDVILSEIIKLVQQIPGVDSCVMTSPTADQERITIGDNAIARISTNSITLS